MQTATTQPTGVKTFLFTDIEGSTRLWETYPQGMKAALRTHDALLRRAIEEQGGHVFKTGGDAFYAAFASPHNALIAAVSAQRALRAQDWGDLPAIRVRMAVHAGVVDQRDGDYFGPPLNRVARMLSAGYGGQILVSLSAKQWLQEPLPADIHWLDLGQHRFKDLTEPERVFQLTSKDLPAAFPALNSLDAHYNNLPVQPTPLVGREAEIASACALLRSEQVRLVTFIGPAGVGKSRLSLHVAAEMVEGFANGVYFVPLSNVDDPELVAFSIAQVLSLREVGSLPLIDSMKDYLRDKQIILVLDNFEQVVSAAPIVSALLSSAPFLKVLATSREPLRVRGEHEFPVSSLSLPPLQVTGELPLHVSDTAQYDAVKLFASRAQAVKPSFAISEENASAVVEICRRLDGLPLAIELAAPYVRILSPDAMLARMGSRLNLLTHGARDLPARQQTLRNAIEWSYNLLSVREQALFRRLSVFADHSTLDAIEVVCSIPGNPPVQVIDQVLSLMAKSLLRQAGAPMSDVSFTMLETIREYAVERLEESPERYTIRMQHAHYYLRMAEQAAPELQGSNQKIWLERLEAEHSNLRAALSWSKANDSEVFLGLCMVLWRFWYIRGHLSEGLRWLELAFDRERQDSSSATIRNAMISILMDQGDYDRASVLLRENLAFFRQVDDEPGIASCLNHLGVLASNLGDYVEATGLFTQALDLRRKVGNNEEIAASLNNLAHAAIAQGDYSTAQSLLEESSKLFGQVGNRRGVSISLNNMGHVALNRKDYEVARHFYEESLVIKRELGDKLGIASSLCGLGNIERYLGNYSQASSLYLDSLNLCREVGDKQVAVSCLLGLAHIAQVEERPLLAARLLGLVQVLLDKSGAALDALSATQQQHLIDKVKGYVPHAAWDIAFSAGRAISLEQAILEVKDAC